ncbi:NAD(P)/FAD-dependent oxidoreductase [Limibaculum sp. FT325]|uniref:FAD/NAD(P)-dependent oxidoreductase n=1 Tax=Thermohalobaculum sediminis TaxID=2939436 RepID=UPI0020C1679F|nr:FAD/NAD(P)-binding oxidoreductase [Limibaculum sediminis]MCL5776277.1 NAD(P)/FAD-dependent oxidoreductase [Limibaculum sediminis]
MRSDRIVIVGAGPAGMRAALVLAGAGLNPVVLDEAPASGGQIYRRQPRGFTRAYDKLYGFEAGRARALHAAFDADNRIDHRSGTLVWNIEGRRLQTLHDGRPETVEFDRLLLATGAMDRVIPFPGWTRPGVYTLGGAQVALKHQACAIGRRVVFFGASPLLPLVASQYAAAGAEVAAVLDTTPLRAKLAAMPGLLAGGKTGWKGLVYLARLAARRIPYRHGITPVAALGSESVEGFAYTDASGRRHEIECDAIAFGYGLKSEWQLADLAGCGFEFDAGNYQWQVVADEAGRSTVPGVYLAGDGTRIGGAELAEIAGERAARAILTDLGDTGQGAALAACARRIGGQARLRRAIERAFPFPAPLARAIPDDCILCRCEAVTAGEFRASIDRLAPHDVNRAKAFSRVGMGRCQGRICGPAAAEILAAARGVEVKEAGRLRSQPPVKPVPVAAFADAAEDAA